MVKIGKLKLETAAPDEARLLSGTGLSVAEMGQYLRRSCSAGTVAAALEACIADPPHRHALAELIAAAGVEKVRRQLLGLYPAPKEVLSEEEDEEP